MTTGGGTGSRWLAVLVSVLGACEVLLAFSAVPLATSAAGVLGGALVGVAPWVRGRAARWALPLAAVGALPFAVLTWSSLASPLVAVLALGLLVVVARGSSAGRVLP